MKRSRTSPETYFEKTVYDLNLQSVHQEKLMRSTAMKHYAKTIEISMSLMREAISENTFEALIAVERAIQKVELERFSHDEEMVAAIQKTQRDLAAGMKDHRILRVSLLKRAEYLYEELQIHAFSLPKTP